jgi:hypothetical protein
VRKLLLILLLLIGALLAIACDGGHLPAGPEHSTARIRAFSRDVPYEVIIDVYDINGAHEGRDEIITKADAAWTTEVNYNPGVKLKIRVEVKPPRIDSHPFCEIWDGTAHTVSDPGRGSWRAICELTTAR